MWRLHERIKRMDSSKNFVYPVLVSESIGEIRYVRVPFFNCACARPMDAKTFAG